jgi:AcrR family transcriptional regulator
MKTDDTPKPRRSAVTKATILNVARQRFASDGYELATIRAIAADAGIDPALVIRYYGNKESLFAAAAEFDLQLPDLTKLEPDDASKALVEHFLSRWEQDDTLKALLRAAVTNESAVTKMQTIFASQLGPTIAELSGLPIKEAATRAGLLATQMLGIALCRYIIKLPAVMELKRTEIVNWLAPTVRRYVFEHQTSPESPRPNR